MTSIDQILAASFLVFLILVFGIAKDRVNEEAEQRRDER